MLNRVSRNMKRLHRHQDGVTGLETAIILIAFVIVASVFAFVVLSTGLFSAERGKQTVLAGLEKASGNVELRGSVTAIDVDTDGAFEATEDLIFNLSTAAGGRPVLVDPAATTNTTVMNIVDATGRTANLTYVVLEVLGDGDDLLENGELFEITIDIPNDIAVNEEWTLEVIPPSGGTLLINRIMPPQIDDVMDLK
jgi:flagellin FlaB